MPRLAQVIVSLCSADPSLRWRALAACLVLGVASSATGCRTVQSPQLHVIGVHEEPRHDVVFVQVTNPVGRAMRLTRLEYRFAAAGPTAAPGGGEERAGGGEG